jgi:hypothetical protein
MPIFDRIDKIVRIFLLILSVIVSPWVLLSGSRGFSPRRTLRALRKLENLCERFD